MKHCRLSDFSAQLNDSPIVPIESELLNSLQVQVSVKRDDLIHPIVSGNKWRKLKHLLHHIESRGLNNIAVMGGAYSNLIHAVAYIGKQLGWHVNLHVRAHPGQALTPTLQDALNWGAKINYVSRKDYRELRLKPSLAEAGEFWIGEGGFHSLALAGMQELIIEIEQHFDFIVMATATGISLAGLALGAMQQQLSTKIVGVAVLDNIETQQIDIQSILNEHCAKTFENFCPMPQIIESYTFGGYAKVSTELIDFIQRFYEQYQIPLEPVYNGKSFYAVMDLIRQGFFPANSRVLLIHCGGLQGLRGHLALQKLTEQINGMSRDLPNTQ
ncbi:1-aminocyclopropane-1-carboxylate deaminase/D-cysteine desulfhydrase [Aliikangiella maris]|uniref:Pyridoxal-phosphate dependent enzyme n=2 Tax=Aliikangiella maris TaxID=3162458 RepID=A0ABV2BVL8_9GAMM